MNQELKEIYIEIAKGITNYYDDDIRYIASQIDKYRDHPRNTDIIRKLGILFYDLLPEGQKHDLVKVIRMDEDNVHLLFFIAQYLITMKEYDKALDILTIVVEELERWEISTGKEQFFSFDTLIELLIYAQSHETSKEIKRSRYPFHEFYRAIAAIQYAKQNYEEADKAHQKARLHNPVDTDTLLDNAEVVLALGDDDAYAAMTKEALLYAYDIETLARCYRNLGSYFLKEGNLDTAKASYYMSMVFEKNDMAFKALYKIYEITKQELTVPELDEIQKTLEAANIQVGASALAVDTLLQLAKEYDEISERKEAIRYLEMAHQLTNDDSLLPVIEELKATLPAEQ